MYFVRSQVDGPITEVRREGREGAYKWVIIARAGDTKMWAKIISASAKKCSRYRFSRLRGGGRGKKRKSE